MTQTKLSRTKRITLKDLYLKYPNKINIPHPANTVPYPYVKKEDVVENSLSLDFYQWQEIVMSYLDVIKEELSEGNAIQIPQRLGTLQMRKFKIKKFFDRIKSTKENRIYMYRNDHDNYMLKLFWYRRTIEAAVPLRWYWSISPIRSFMRSIYETCEKNYTHLYKFIDK